MDLWQIVLLAFLVLLPMALLLDFWPDRERLTRSGEPIERAWLRQIRHEPHDEDH